MNLIELEDAQVFSLLNEVVAEANKRQAVAELQSRITAALQEAGTDEEAADAAYNQAKQEVFE